MKSYYILVEEWNYPTETGRETVDITFDDKDEALKYASLMCEKEDENYCEATGCDSLPAGHCVDDENGKEGYILTDKNGVEPFYYFVRLFEIKPIE